MTSHPIVSYYLATIMMEEHRRRAERSRFMRSRRKGARPQAIAPLSNQPLTAADNTEEVERVPSLV
jgi:hypothetical protein